ncbi:MAG: ABC transporter permease [Terriglobales bacterium]
MDFRAVGAVAGQELRINIRNRWVLSFAVVFAVLTLAISYFGMVTSAVVGFQSFTRTSASLLNLVLYLVPLVSLTMSALSFTGDRGYIELIFSQPVTRTEVLLGKLAGLVMSFAAATFFGFGISGFVVAWNSGTEGMARFLTLVCLTLVLAVVFAGLGALVAIVAESRNKAFVTVLALWFFFVLFYDLMVIGGALLLKQRTANLLVFLSLFGNPVDLARVSSLIALGGATIFGAAGSALLKFLGGGVASFAMLCGALIFWSIVPVLLARFALQRRDV